MNASPNRHLDVNYLLSIGLQFSNRYPWNQVSIGLPISRYNYQTCQYDGGTVTNFPTNQYPEIMDWVNLSYYKKFVYNQMIEEKCSLVFYPTEIEGSFAHQLDPNIINVGHHYMPPDYSKIKLSSSLESALSTETGYNPPMKSNQLNSISMQSLHTQQDGSIATPAHIPSEPKKINLITSSQLNLITPRRKLQRPSSLLIVRLKTNYDR